MKKMKKLGLMLLVLAIALGSAIPVSFAAQADVKFVINGKPYVTPKGEPAPYVNKDYRTLVPVRFFADALGLRTNWDQKTMTATLSHGSNKVQITLGSYSIYVNGKTVYMDTRAELKNGRTFIPARFIAESFGGKIGFVSATNTVSIDLTESDMPKQEKPDQVAKTDPYGRKIRTTNLPKNYADFEYILEDIPNEAYEMEYWGGYDPDRFFSPKDFKESFTQVTDENIAIWVEKAKNYYDLILNVDYRTIDYTWGDKLWENMSHGVNEAYTRQKFKEYVDWVKENEIVIKGSVSPEPSIVYNSGISRNIRAKIEFEIVNYKSNDDVIYDPLYKYVKDDLKKGTKYSGYFDIALANNHYTNDWGPYLAVSANTSIFTNPNIPGIRSAYSPN